MRKLIAKIRKKPNEVKDRIALGVASVFTLIVFSFWFYNITSTGGSEFNSDTEEVSQNGIFSNLVGDLSEQVANVKESFHEATAGVDSLKTASSATEILNEAVRDYRESSTTETVKNNPEEKEVRIVTIKSTTSTSSQETE